MRTCPSSFWLLSLFFEVEFDETEISEVTSHEFYSEIIEKSNCGWFCNAFDFFLLLEEDYELLLIVSVSGGVEPDS